MLPGKRRQIIVSGLQYKLLLIHFLYLFAVIIVFLAAVYVPIVAAMESEFLPTAKRDEAAKLLLALHGRIWPGVSIVIVLTMLHSVVVSHRIAGPLYRFRQVFKTLGAGDFSIRTRIRRNDYLHDDADAMNEMIDKIADKMERIHESYRDTSRTLDEFIGAAGARTEEVAVLAGKLGTQLDFLGRAIRTFRVPFPDETIAGDGDASPAAARAREPNRAPVP